jgi:hypothetical protein
MYFFLALGRVDHRGASNAFGDLGLGMLGIMWFALYFAPLTISVWLILIGLDVSSRSRRRRARTKWATSYVCYRCGKTLDISSQSGNPNPQGTFEEST